MKSRIMRWAGHIARMWEERSIQGFGGQVEGKRRFGRNRRSQEDNINPQPANVENIVELLIMPAKGRWDLIPRLKG
jgi:hypothetical protein